MVQQGELTRFQRFRMMAGMLTIGWALAAIAIHADDGVAITVWHCTPEAWGYWLNLAFGSETVAGYLRWISCAALGLP